MSLAHESCSACQHGAEPASAAERQQYLNELPDWKIEQIDGIDQLVRRFAFADFKGALAFTNRVGALAEAAGHHPSLLTEWGAVTVRWWTHKIGGLHKTDFVMAARTDLEHQPRP